MLWSDHWDGYRITMFYALYENGRKNNVKMTNVCTVKNYMGHIHVIFTLFVTKFICSLSIRGDNRNLRDQCCSRFIVQQLLRSLSTVTTLNVITWNLISTSNERPLIS